MSFPWDDPAWCEVGDLLERVVDSGSGPRILAPDLFWWRVPELWRYVPANVAGDDAFDVVVVHKGEMPSVPRPFLEAVAATMRPVCANAVFVVFSAGDDDRPSIDRTSEHFVAFVARLAHLPAAPESPHPAVADRVLGTSPTLRRFASMSAADARRAQDEFFTGSGYVFPTRRDQAYYHDLLDHRDRLLAETPGKRVLDLCCGEFPAGRVADGAILVRGDFSPVGVANARDRDHDTGAMHLVCDASAAAIADSSCDVVLFVDAIEHVFDAGAVLREAGRVLRPGGELLVTFANRNSLNQLLTRALGYPEFVTNHQHIREFTLAEVEAMLEEAELTVESTAGIELRPYWGVPGVDPVVRRAIDDDEEFVEALHVLGERAGAEYAYVGVVRARKRG